MALAYQRSCCEVEAAIEISSERLMTAVAKGDLDAFDEIVVRHQKLAWGIAYRFLGDRHEAEELAQEAFMRILDAAPRYRPTATFRTYLYRILTHLCLDHRRKKRPILSDSLFHHPERKPSPAEQAEQHDREQLIEMALDALPADYRMAVVLRYFEGLSSPEIAEAMDRSAKAVERLLARARDVLESRLRPLV